MKSKIIMRIVSVIAALITIYTVFIYNPYSGMITDDQDNGGDDVIESDSSISSEEEIYVGGFDDDPTVVNIGELTDMLTTDENSVVIGILDDLSVTDCAKINSILNENSSDSIKKAFEYMKKRLSKDDYNRIYGIFNQYLELEE